MDAGIQRPRMANYGLRQAYRKLEASRPCAGFLHPCWNDSFVDTARLVYNDWGSKLGNAVLEARKR